MCYIYKSKQNQNSSDVVKTRTITMHLPDILKNIFDCEETVCMPHNHRKKTMLGQGIRHSPIAWAVNGTDAQVDATNSNRERK